MIDGYKILSADDDGDDDDVYDDGQTAQILGLVPNTFQDEIEEDNAYVEDDKDSTSTIEGENKIF